MSCGYNFDSLVMSISEKIYFDKRSWSGLGLGIDASDTIREAVSEFYHYYNDEVKSDADLKGIIEANVERLTNRLYATVLKIERNQLDVSRLSYLFTGSKAAILHNALNSYAYESVHSLYLKLVGKYNLSAKEVTNIQNQLVFLFKNYLERGFPLDFTDDEIAFLIDIHHQIMNKEIALDAPWDMKTLA